MKYKKLYITKFGNNEYGFADLPEKVSGTTISRISACAEGVCSFCFPHGSETKNSRWRNMQRCWKRQRKTQYKTKEI